MLRALSILSFFFAIFHPLQAEHLSHQTFSEEPCLLLITGCGRSGTEYIVKFLQSSGLRFRHENYDIDGCASWPMTVNHYSPWGPFSLQRFFHCFHQTRDPLAVITSWYVNLHDIDRDEWKFVRDHIPEIKREDSLLIHCAKYWYYWNLLAEKKAELSYRIEEIKTLLPEFERRLGIELSPDVLNLIPTNTNSWKDTSTKITWSDLKSGLPDDLYENVRQMAIRYGYPAPDA